MGMTIDDAMNHIKYGIIENNYPLQRDLGIEACNVALDTMRKYQKIVNIVSLNDEEFKQCGLKELKEILEAIADGKID